MAAIYESGLYTDSNETFKIASKDSLPKFKCYHSFHLGNFFEQTDFFFLTVSTTQIMLLRRLKDIAT